MSSQVLTTDREKKEYIKKTWGVSSGRRIKEMLQKYWHSQKDQIQQAEEIFDINKR